MDAFESLNHQTQTLQLIRRRQLLDLEQQSGEIMTSTPQMIVMMIIIMDGRVSSVGGEHNPHSNPVESTKVLGHLTSSRRSAIF